MVVGVGLDLREAEPPNAKANDMSKVFLLAPSHLSAPTVTPHLGCAMLSAALTQHGHEVRVLDYAYLREAERDADAVRAQLLAFRPDCVGVSVYTASVSLARETMRQAKELLGVPIIVGGPHATLYPEAMIGLDYVDTVVTGDGEVTLPLVVSEPARYAKQIVQGGQLDITTLPTADFSTFYGSERILIYPLQTSRGCPFNCSFCTVHTVTSRRWRPRDLQPVMAELDGALERLPQIREIQIHDDCPTLDVGRFKELLRQVAARQTARKLTVANIRADSVDDELVSLMLQAGCDSVCIAAEHGNPDVFDLIGKAETLADIERAATTIRRHGARLGLCFTSDYRATRWREPKTRFASPDACSRISSSGTWRTPSGIAVSWTGTKHTAQPSGTWTTTPPTSNPALPVRNRLYRRPSSPPQSAARPSSSAPLRRTSMTRARRVF